MSHHNVATGNDKIRVFPSDLAAARNNLGFVEKGFYAKDAIEPANAYPAPPAMRTNQQLDPRLVNNPGMMGPENTLVRINNDLMAEIDAA